MTIRSPCRLRAVRAAQSKGPRLAGWGRACPRKRAGKSGAPGGVKRWTRSRTAREPSGPVHPQPARVAVDTGVLAVVNLQAASARPAPQQPRPVEPVGVIKPVPQRLPAATRAGQQFTCTRVGRRVSNERVLTAAPGHDAPGTTGCPVCPAPARWASSASTAFRRARIGPRTAESGRARAKLAANSRRATSSSRPVSAVTHRPASLRRAGERRASRQDRWL